MRDHDDFPAEPHRAADPSLEEMLRRARDAQLGDNPDPPTRYPANLRPIGAPVWQRWRGGRLPGVTSFLAVLCVGMLLIAFGYGAGALTSRPPLPAAPTPGALSAAPPDPPPTATSVPTPTDAPVPTATATPAPTPTPLPTVTPTPMVSPLTTGEIAALVRDYYDHVGPTAGSYVLRAVTGLQIQRQDGSRLSVCVAYAAAEADTPDTEIGSNTRVFTLSASDGSWHVVHMGGPNSCRLR